MSKKILATILMSTSLLSTALPVFADTETKVGLTDIKTEKKSTASFESVNKDYVKDLKKIAQESQDLFNKTDKSVDKDVRSKLSKQYKLLQKLAIELEKYDLSSQVNTKNLTTSLRSKDELNKKIKTTEESLKTKKEELSKKKAAKEEADKKAAAEKAAKEKAAKEKADRDKKAAETNRSSNTTANTGGSSYDGNVPAPANSEVEWNGDGTLKIDYNETPTVRNIINIMASGNGFVSHTADLDTQINSLTVPQALYVLHTIEGPGFGQTAAGWAGDDSAASHRAFVEQQLNGRFGGSIHELLRKWGTIGYPGY